VYARGVGVLEERRGAMQKDDFETVRSDSEDLLWAAQPEQLQAGIRFLACQVAYARRHQEYLPLEEIKEWVEAGRKDPRKREVVVEGMEQIIEVLTALGVEVAAKSAI
jgi:hypothetical protein